MDNLKLNISQRRFLADNFKDALVNQDVDKEPYFKRLGATVQATMREAVNFVCLYKPIQGTISEKKVIENGEEIVKQNITIKIELFQPGTNDKIVLERMFTKSLLDMA